jgi:hypothetical protein
MYMSTLAKIALRRWPLVVLALLMTACGMYAVATTVRPEFQSSASVVLIPPRSTEDPDSNRYLALGSLDQAVGVVTRSLVSDEVRAQVAAEVPDGTYDVTADWATSAPILVVTAHGASSAVTDELLTAALAQIPTVLQQLQKSIGVPDSQEITSLPLTRDEAPSRVLKPLIRALVAAAALLLSLSLGLIALIDGLQLRRARRRAAGGGPSGSDEDDFAVAVSASTVDLTLEERTPELDVQVPVTTGPRGEKAAVEVDAVTSPQAQTAPPSAEPSPSPSGGEPDEQMHGRGPRQRSRQRNGRHGTPALMPLRVPEWQQPTGSGDDAPEDDAQRAAG